VQTVANLSSRPQNVEACQNADVMSLRRPLLLDNVLSIQQSAALAMGDLQIIMTESGRICCWKRNSIVTLSPKRIDFTRKLRPLFFER
jgi:hypothetical protein